MTMHDDGNGNEFRTEEGADLSRILIHYFRNADAGGEPSEIAGAVQGIDQKLHTLETRLAALEADRDQAGTFGIHGPAVETSY